MKPHNTILKLKGLREWIAVTEGTGIHLTGEKENAFEWRKDDAELIKRHWEAKHNTPLELHPVKKKRTSKNKHYAQNANAD